MTPPFRWLYPLFILCLALTACGKANDEFPVLSREAQVSPEGESLVKSDPAGPIPQPQVPSLSSEEAADPVFPAEVIKYRVEIRPEKKHQTIEAIFRDTAELFVLADKPVTNPMTLTRRLRSSLEKGQEILRSQGHYEGKVTGWTEKNDKSPDMVVVINFDPGPVYHLGESWVKVGKDPEPEPGAQDPKAPVEPPVVKDPAAKVLPPVDAPPPSTDLTKSGWVAGERALADQVLAMVENNVSVWTAKGYPKAKTIETHYFLDPDKKLLNAEVTLDPGYYALMGPLVVEGDGAVETAYIENLVTWQVGEVWDQRLLDRFVDAMFQTGLFKTVDPVIGEEDDYGHRPILVTLSATPFKTVSGSVNFDSDFGPGIILSWEHRNFTARGDRLRLEFPAWADLIQFGASYVRPYFLSPKQNLLLDFSAIHERAQAYALTAVSAAGGIERQLTRHLSGLFQLSLEAGRLEEDDKPQSEYTIYGLPSALSWDFSDDYLNPTKGSRVKISVEPYTGTYFDSFNVIKSRLDASHYFPITDAGRLVFAVRGAAGGIWGAERTSLPATLRFYGGGGGSMRGYEYQSVGPRNDRDEPDGGGAMAEVSGEVRVRFGESLGATVFVDGGMVYDRPDFDKIGQSFLWGGGLGFRYYTPIGPFRLDLATPLTPRKDDNPLQFYLSLGQSF